MATVLFSGITDGATITFDPAVDVLRFDDNALSAASLILDYADDLTQITMTIDGKTFFLPTSVSLPELNFVNVTFDDGSLLLAGAGSAETLVGDGDGDYLLGFGGSDQLSGGSGDDLLDGGTGVDRMFGGLGDDIYVVDNASDIASDIPALTRRVSLTEAGAETNGESLRPGISGNGRYIVFSSEADNLVAGDSNGDSDIFVKDMATGEVTRLSESSASAQADNDSFNAKIAADGRYVIFESSATNLVGGDGNGVSDIFRKDMQTGTTTRASTSSAGVEADAVSSFAEITDDGNFVVFESSATNLVAGDNNNRADIFVKNLTSGVTVRASTSSVGGQSNDYSVTASITADGDHVVFTSNGSNLIGTDTNGVADIYVKNLQTNAIERVSVSSAEVQANGASSWAEVASDGRYVVFQSDATNLVAGDTNGVRDIFVRDLVDGTTQRVNTSAADVQTNATSYDADISADGRYVVFMSTATNLVAGTPSSLHAFVKDLQTGGIALVSASSLGTAALSPSTHVQISADGRAITFKSLASTLTDDDNNATADIFTVENPLMYGGTDTVKSSVSWTLDSSIENLSLFGSAAINGTGNSSNNVIAGNAARNVLNGGAGSDTLIGGAGNDTYVLNDADTITELSGGGTDIVQASLSYTLAGNLENLTLTGAGAINGTGNSGDNVITGNSGNNVLTGGGGDDTLTGGGGTNTLLGGNGDDVYFVSSAADILVEDAGEGSDTVRSSISYTLGSNLENLVLSGTASINGTGNSSNNVITGNSGNNTLTGGGGADRLIGGTGNDTYVIGEGDLIIEGVNAGTDTIVIGGSFTLTTANIENLFFSGTGNFNGTGNSDNNVITGNSGNNILTGGDGNDTLSGGAGADTLRGGAGDDTYVLSSGDTFTELADQGNDTVVIGTNYTLGTTSIENLTLSGTGNIKGTGNNVSNFITGNSGNNTLTGNGGNDTLYGGGGVDSLKGGKGNDTYILTKGGTIVEAAGAGTDTVQANFTYTLRNNLENLTLIGTANINGKGNGEKNEITGNSGDNILDGGSGGDTLRGGRGNDTYVVGNGDKIAEGANAGIDTVKADKSFKLGANLENLTLNGKGDLNGKGNSLDNFITGNNGDNKLSGGAGNDFLVGGGGNNTYVFNTALGANNADVLIDFSSRQDVIHLDNSVFKKLSSGGFLSNANFAFNPGGNALDGNDYIIVSTTTGALYYDADGSGAGARVQFATVLDDVSPFDFFII